MGLLLSVSESLVNLRIWMLGFANACQKCQLLMGLYFFVLTISRFWNWNEEIVVYEQELVNLQISPGCLFFWKHSIIFSWTSKFSSWLDGFWIDQGWWLGMSKSLVNLQIWILVFQNACQMPGGCSVLNMYESTWVHRRGFDLDLAVLRIHTINTFRTEKNSRILTLNIYLKRNKFVNKGI